jgi:AcrR family transcriptional regulator
MPRPSLKSVRTAELLEAFERCVARYGLDGSTLERISEEAHVGRPLLRHYLGNRDQMVSALLQHILAKFDDLNEALVAELPTVGRFEALLDRLFNDPLHDANNAAVFQALVASSNRYEGMAEKLMRFVTNFEEILAKELSLWAPEASLPDCQVAASGIAAIYFSVDGLAPLTPPRSWKNNQRQAVQWLLDRLKS